MPAVPATIHMSGDDEMGMLVLLSIVGMGMFLLLILLAFLAAKVVTKNNTEEDMEGIVEAEEDEFSEHLDSIDNARAIFIIGERSKSNTSDIVNEKILSETTDQSDESGRNTANMENKSSKIERLMSTFKILRFSKRWIEVS
jgi:uncharacterized UPF0160 family protein